MLNDGTDADTGVQLLKPETMKGMRLNPPSNDHPQWNTVYTFLTSSVIEMFKDQIPDLPRDCNEYSPVAKPLLANPTPLSPSPDGKTEGWGFSFSISHFPEDTGRAAGAASWEGIANLFWFADRTNNVGGLIASQILPYGGKLCHI